MTLSTVRWLGAGGIIAPIAFVASVLLHSSLRADHNLGADPISALAAGPSGWVQDLTFVVTGVLMIGFAIGLQLAVAPVRAGAVGPALVALFGVALLGLGVFPATDAAGEFTEDRVAHIVGTLVLFASATLAPLALSWRLARDPAWRDLAGVLRAVGVVLVLLFIVSAAFVAPPGAPLHEWIAVFQWASLAGWFPLVVVLALRLVGEIPAAV